MRERAVHQDYNSVFPKLKMQPIVILMHFCVYSVYFMIYLLWDSSFFKKKEYLKKQPNIKTRILKKLGNATKDRVHVLVLPRARFGVDRKTGKTAHHRLGRQFASCLRNIERLVSEQSFKSFD